MHKRFSRHIAGILILLACLLLACLLLACPSVLAVNISAESNPASLPAGGEATLTITLSNDGAASMENIQISSAYSGISFETAGYSVAPGESRNFSTTVVLSDSAVGQALTFDVSWTEAGEPRSGSATVDVYKRQSSMLPISSSMIKPDLGLP